jgi:hypothetical protein
MDFVSFIVFKLNCGMVFNHYEQLLVVKQIMKQINFASQIECKFYKKINLIAKRKEDTRVNKIE